MRERERASGQIRTKCKNKYNILQSIYNEQYIEDQCGYLPVINEFSPLPARRRMATAAAGSSRTRESIPRPRRCIKNAT